MAYDYFAQFYENLMQDAEYSKRCEYILKLAQMNNHEMGLTLDLACGTGSLTRELCKRGVDAYGADASEEMLCEAFAKSSEENLNILYIKQRMQELDLYGTINTCVCTLDSINHLTDINDVQKTFDRLALFIEQNGLFIFDVNTVYKHQSVLADNVFVIEDESVYCVWQNSLQQDNTVDITLDFFEEEDGVYYRSTESFSERSYTDDQLRQMLTNSGFEVVSVYGDMKFEPPSSTEQRAIYVAKMVKPRNKNS